MAFETLHIKSEYLNILKNHGITEPTDIQAQAIPVITEGQDVIAESQTGTGKTLAYLLPVLQKIDVESKELQAVVIVPTRELSMQILREIEMLHPQNEMIAQALIGGVATKRQLEKLRLHPQIIVGTPGRILELIKIRKLKMHEVKTIVVDEVDQVFDLGSMKEVEDIMGSALRDRQIVFFSATIPSAIQKVADKWMSEPVQISINPTQRTSEHLEHLYFISEERDKADTLRKIVRQYNPKSCIVFINQIEDIAELIAKLQYVGIKAQTLYGELDKQERAAVLGGFREGKFQVLLATDVAARGLDIKEVSHVINFDPPMDADHYVHRVGRTGRMGQKGTAISIITAKEKFIIDKFSKTLDITIMPKEMYKGEVRDLKPGDRISRSRPVTKPVYSGKVDREKDLKNKGAPKWLKDKDKNK
jgi:ATP-dependent RNA helicase DeaD